jgi:aminopeptidase Y
MFTGAGAPQDPCYHQACDNLDNIHWEALTLNAKAAARVAAEFALSLEGVPARKKTSANPRHRRNVARNLQKWKRAAEEAEHEHLCAHKADNIV